MHPLLIAFALIATPAMPALAASSFDGRWSVLIVTERGDCDRAYRYEVKVENGNLKYDGEGGFDLSGAVAANGAVNVAIGKGSQSATGRGRLTARGGQGSWQGRSANGACAGRWEAERR